MRSRRLAGGTKEPKTCGAFLAAASRSWSLAKKLRGSEASGGGGAEHHFSSPFSSFISSYPRSFASFSLGAASS